MLWALVIRGISSIENSIAPLDPDLIHGVWGAERIGEADDCLSLAQGPAGGDGPHGQQDVGGREDRRLIDDRGALLTVRLVGKSGGGAGALFDGNLEPGFLQRRRARRDDRDSCLARPGFLGYSDLHLLSSRAACLLQRGHLAAVSGGESLVDLFVSARSPVPMPQSPSRSPG